MLTEMFKLSLRNYQWDDGIGINLKTLLHKALKKEMADQSNAMHIAAAYQQISPKTIHGWLQMNFHYCSTT